MQHKYRYSSDMAALKYDLQQIVYDLDKAIFMDGDNADRYFNYGMRDLEGVVFKFQAWQQDQAVEEQADMADYIRRIEDEIPY